MTHFIIRALYERPNYESVKEDDITKAGSAMLTLLEYRFVRNIQSIAMIALPLDKQ